MNLFKHRYLTLPSLIISGGFLLSSMGAAANAASMSFSLGGSDNFGSQPVKADFTLTEVDSTSVQFDIAVDTTVNWADLRGVFFNLKNESLVDSLTYSSDTYINKKNKTQNYITGASFGANSVINVSGGVNLQGDGSSNDKAFDGGFALGTNGIGKDDLQFASFTLSHTSGLSLADFYQEGFGVRMTSVGPTQNGAREGSSKVAGYSPIAPILAQVNTLPPPTQDIPEPAALVGLGLVGFAAARSRRSEADSTS